MKDYPSVTWICTELLKRLIILCSTSVALKQSFILTISHLKPRLHGKFNISSGACWPYRYYHLDSLL